MAVKQTAGRDALGEFAPKFAELNDDVLFGQVYRTPVFDYPDGRTARIYWERLARRVSRL